MRNQGLELAAERVPLDPVDHEATEARAGGDAVVGIDVGDVVADVFPALDEVDVGGSAWEG